MIMAPRKRRTGSVAGGSNETKHTGPDTPKNNTTEKTTNRNQYLRKDSVEDCPSPGPSNLTTQDEVISLLDDVQINDSSDDTDLTESEAEKPKLAKSTICGHNVPEKIVLVFDRVKDEVETNFFECGDQRINPRKVMLRAFKFFVCNKLEINKKHQFAVIALNENSASWKLDFTNDIRKIEFCLENISGGCQTEDIFDVNTVFEEILNNVDTGGLSDNIEIIKSVLHVVFCYGRSFTMPKIEINERIKDLLNVRSFIFDVIVTHEQPSSDNNCEKIFEVLQSLNLNGMGYFFAIGRNVNNAHLAMAKILAHPLQRAAQKDANYTPLRH